MSNTVTRLWSFGYRVVDVDIGDIFLSFPLRKSMSHSGVDLTPFKMNLKCLLTYKLKHNKHLRNYRLGLSLNKNILLNFYITFYYLDEEFIGGKHDD